jgi:hypothetical protein
MAGKVMQNIKQLISYYRFPAMLVVLTLFMVVVIEITHPYFFLQDDNRVLYLPFYVHNFRALLGGEFPFYNFHQYLGTPVTIQYAALYPINYIALGLSKLLLGNYFGAMELIAVFHLVVAALGFFSLMRFFELEEISCFFGAIAWTFCGFVIIVGNSWIQTVGFAAYLPWILLFSIKQIYRFDIRCFLILVFLKVCEMLLGYPQLFVYTATFEFITVVMLFVANTKKSAALTTAATEIATCPTFVKLMSAFIVNYLFVAIITLPLVLQTLHQTSVSANRRQLLSWDEYAAFSYNLKYWFSGLLAPYRPVDTVTQFELHFISHIGYLTIIFILIAITPLSRMTSGLLINYKNRVGGKEILVFCLLALLSLLWAGDIIVTKILYYVPLYNRLRFPFKVAFFTSFYLVIIATFGFDMFYDKMKSIKGISRNVVAILFPIILIFHISNFLTLYAAAPQKMFSRHSDPVPFDEPLKEKFTDGRIVSASLDDVFDGEKIVPGFSAPLLGFDYATLWGVFHFGGYDPMVSEKAQVAALGIKNNPVYNLPANEPFSMPPETFAYFRKWGVKWYVVNNAIPLNDDGVLKLFSRDRHRNVLMDPSAKPLVYWQNDPYNSNDIRYKFKTNSIEVEYMSTAGGTIIINTLHHPFFSAQVDGKALLITETDDNQVSISVPKGQHRLFLKYCDKYFIFGSVVSAVFLLMLIPCLLHKRVKNAIMKTMS